MERKNIKAQNITIHAQQHLLTEDFRNNEELFYILCQRLNYDELREVLLISLKIKNQQQEDLIDLHNHCVVPYHHMKGD